MSIRRVATRMASLMEPVDTPPEQETVRVGTDAFLRLMTTAGGV